MVSINRGPFLTCLSLTNHRCRMIKLIFVNIAEPDNLYRRNLYQAKQIALAIPARSNQRNSARGSRTQKFETARLQSGERQRRRSVAKKIPSMYFLLWHKHNLN